MDDTQKMLRTIINGQSTFRQELLGEVGKLGNKVDDLGERLEGRIDRVEKNLTLRIDKLGRQLAYLEDDAPTREEFDNLEKKVDRIIQKTSQSV